MTERLRPRRRVRGWLGPALVAIVLAACAGQGPGGPSPEPSTGAAPSPTSQATPSESATPGPASPSPVGSSSPGSPGSSPDLSGCPDLEVDLVGAHQAPDVERLLPPRVSGRDLSIWSVAGWCWIRLAGGEDGVASFSQVVEQESIDVAELRYGVAGRSNVAADPPYFVYGAWRPMSDSTNQLAMALLIGGAGFVDVLSAMNPATYGTTTIAGREVYVGDTSMLRQDEHQRGIPYLVESADYAFLVITDEPSWAEEAIAQLPR